MFYYCYSWYLILETVVLTFVYCIALCYLFSLYVVCFFSDKFHVRLLYDRICGRTNWLFMYVCIMYVCVCVCIYVCVCMCVCMYYVLCMYVCMYNCMCVCVCICIHSLYFLYIHIQVNYQGCGNCQNGCINIC